MTWTAIFSADLHLSNSLPHAKPVEVDGVRPGLTDRFFDQLDVVEQIGEIASKRKVDAIFLLGDIWDKRLLDAVTLRHGVEAIISLSKIAPVYLLPGNHDADNSRAQKTHRFTSEVFEAFSGPSVRVKYLDGTPFRIEGESVVFYPLPWSPLEAARLRLEEFRKAREAKVFNVLLFHQSVRGAFQQAWACDEGFTKEELCEGWDLVLGGHFHTGQDFAPEGFAGDALYVGAPMQLHYGEALNATSVVEVGFCREKYKLQRHAIISPCFYSYRWDEKIDAPLCEGDYMKFIVESTSAELISKLPRVEKRADNLRSAGINVHVVHKPVQQHESRLKIGERPSDEEALGQYLQLAEVSGLDTNRLRDIGLAAVKEVHCG